MNKAIEIPVFMENKAGILIIKYPKVGYL